MLFGKYTVKLILIGWLLFILTLLSLVAYIQWDPPVKSGSAIGQAYLQSEAYRQFERELSRADSAAYGEKADIEAIIKKADKAMKTGPRLPFRLDSLSLQSYIHEGNRLLPRLTHSKRFYPIGKVTEGNLHILLMLRVEPVLYGSQDIILAVLRGGTPTAVQKLAEFHRDLYGWSSAVLHWEEARTINVSIRRIKNYPIRQQLSRRYRYSIDDEGAIRRAVVAQ